MPRVYKVGKGFTLAAVLYADTSTGLVTTHFPERVGVIANQGLGRLWSNSLLDMNKEKEWMLVRN